MLTLELKQKSEMTKYFDDNYFPPSSIDENKFIKDHQDDLYNRPTFELSLGRFSPQSSLVNALHHAIETPYCMQDTECKLLLVHSLCNQHTGPIFASDDRHRFDSFSNYTRMQQKKYEIFHDIDPLMFATSLEIRVIAMMSGHDIEASKMIIDLFSNISTKLSRLQVLLDGLDGSSLKRGDQENTLDLCMLYSIALLLIIDSLPDSTITSNSDILKYGLASHFIYRFLGKNSLLSFNDETIRRQCDRASTKLLSYGRLLLDHGPDSIRIVWGFYSVTDCPSVI